MNLLAQISLFAWLPIVVGIFCFLPPRRAVITSYIIAWLALPNIGYSIPGMPNYTKMSATVLAVLLCMIIFDQARLFSIRPRWYDLPITVWCLCPFVTATTNDLGPYEGLSAVVEQIIMWGLPYLIGRYYLTDLQGLRELAIGIVIGGLVYIPLCLFEIRFSPVLEMMVYGIFHWEPERYGGYRPKVFLATGLELGMWMTNATLVCYLLWSCKTVKTLWGISFGILLLALAVTTVLCKSTGAIGLLVVGLVILWLTRRIKRSLLVWMLIAISPTYAITRTFNLWSGHEVVEIANMTVGPDRAESFAYRLNMEDRLAHRALERPFFGWGRFNRSNILDAKGLKSSTIVDGYWIGTLGVSGIVGLTSLIALMLLPMVLTLRRFPVATWFDPQVIPAVALGILLTLTMVDFLSNGMWNPIFAVAIGGLLCQSPVRLGGSRQEAEARLAIGSGLMGEGQPIEAGSEFHRAIELASDGEDVESRRVQAEAFDGLGQSLLATGRLEEAELAFRDGLVVRDWLAEKVPDAGRFRDLAIAREGLSRTLAEIGRTAEAIEERKIALQIWDILATEHPKNPEYRNHRVDALNDLAWLLSTDPDLKLRDPALALHLAEEAVHASVDHVASWNTLGVARYRAGDWAGAIEALERSALSSPNGLGTAFDHYFLAMAWCQLQHEDQAREWFERGGAWASRHRPGHRALERFHEETEALLLGEHRRTSIDVS
jgi:tetratricopeptide (TPR) repeat protein